MGKREPWYRIVNNTEPDTAAEVFIYDEIDSYWGVSADSFVRDLARIDAPAITVRINSPGGNVFDGIAIMNALRGHSATVTTVVDGLAASAASFIAMAGDQVVMSRNAEMMIHDASGALSGNAKAMQEMADNLERVSNNIASIYAERAGGTVEQWRAAMHAETWFSDQEAVDAGLADRVETPSGTADAVVSASFDLSIFNHAGRTQAPAPAIIAAHTLSAERGEESEINREDGIMPTLNEGLREALGITDAEVTDEALLAAVTAVVAERDEALDAATDPAAAPAAGLPDGVVAIDAAQLATLQAAARRGEEARARQEADDRSALVDSAVAAGKIAPASRDRWVSLLAADPGHAEVLNSLAAGTIPVAEIGHAVDAPQTVSDDEFFARISGRQEA
ncbi:peptidase S14 [Rhodococcus sp. D2-41]|uniref:head maturation protease, ClpP-related n=1 Tax=Speluncibacter jeojiensis TaxID=2710754 RepID=UPI0024102047|nr:head maturation protease, ClpP-related [Rhodococcus sp. D2-41]MDG3012154.1 peptidase S14 [Rhodococcus sp. D2-41]